MTSNKNDRTRMTLYRMTELPSAELAIRKKYRPENTEENISTHNYQKKEVSFGDITANLFWGTVKREKATWTETITSLTQEDISIGNTTASAVLIIPDKSSKIDISHSNSNTEISNKECETETIFPAWAITFGMGFQMLDQNYIDPAFGKKIAIRCANPDGLNVISKTTLADRPQMIRSTIPSGGTLQSFAFEELGDIPTRLVVEGHIEGIGDPNKPVKIGGADSLNLPLSTSPTKILENLSQIKKILNKKPATPELEALENLRLIKEARLKDSLDEKLIAAIINNSDEVALSYPYEIIDDFGQVGGFKICGAYNRTINDYLPTLDSLLEPIRRAPKISQCPNILNKFSVVLFRNPDDTNSSSPKIPIKKWLTFQVTPKNAERYFLQNGHWYVMDKKYVDVIKTQVENIFKRGPYFENIPDWPIFSIPEDKDEQKRRNAELQYNKLLADQLGGICLDQKLIYPKGSNSGIEACDILLPDGVFIHVKHVSSSAPASHLLAQALVATEFLRIDSDAQISLRQKIEEAGFNPNEYQTKPSRVVVVMAKDDQQLTADSLFTFTKINLVRHDRRFTTMGVELNIAPAVRKKQE